MTPLNIAGVVFDMDGLLLDTERLYFGAFQRTLTALNLPQDDSIFLRMVGSTHALGREILKEGLANRATLDEFNAIWDADIAVQIDAGIPVKAGVGDLLKCLSNAGLPCAVATSTHTEKAIRHLALAGIGSAFETVIGGDQVTKGKPAPDIYLKAVAGLGLDPVRCAAFEDSETGVRAALSAGLMTIQVPDLVPPSAEILRLGHTIAPDVLTGAFDVGLPTSAC